MKWPFVRRSKYENAMIYGINTAKEITEKTLYIHKIEIYKKIHDEYAKLNHDNLVEINRLNQENQELMEDVGKLINDINRLNQELANELNSHRETKESLNRESLRLSNTIDKLEKELEETEKELEETKDALKIAIDDLKNAALCIGEQKTQLEIWKKRSNFYSDNCTEAKESISKVRGTLRQIAKKL